MTIEQLKELLAKGELSQEDYDAKVAELEATKAKNEGGNEGDQPKTLSTEDIQKLIQSEVDKVRTKYSQEKKELEQKYDTLRQANMSKEDVIKEKETSLRDYELRLKKQELDFETVKLLEEQKLPTKLLHYLPGDDLDARKDHLQTLTGIIDEFTTIKAEQNFKAQGRDIQKGNGDQKPDVSKMSVYDRIMYEINNPQN